MPPDVALQHLPMTSRNCQRNALRRSTDGEVLTVQHVGCYTASRSA